MKLWQKANSRLLPVFRWEFDFPMNISDFLSALKEKTVPWPGWALLTLPWSPRKIYLKAHQDSIVMWKHRMGFFPWSSPVRYRFCGKVEELGDKVVLTGIYQPAPEVKFALYAFSFVLLLFFIFGIVLFTYIMFSEGVTVWQAGFMLLLLPLMILFAYFQYWFLVRKTPSVSARFDLLDMLRDISPEVSFRETQT